MNNENTAFLFALCSPDSRYPNAKQWYLKVTEEDKHQLADVYTNLYSTLAVKFGYNHHFFDQKTGMPINDMAILFHPSVLTSQWLCLAIKMIDKYGVVYVGMGGQIFPPEPNKYIEHSIKSSPVLSFPNVDIKEFIYINKWEGGIHYYLDSSINRIFSKDKYDTIMEAEEEALRYVNKENIRIYTNKKGFKFNNPF